MFALCIIDETYLNICSVGKSMEKTDLVGWYNNGVMFFNSNKKVKYSLYTRFYTHTKLAILDRPLKLDIAQYLAK